MGQGRASVFGAIAVVALYGWAAIVCVQFVATLDFVAGDGDNVWFGTAQVVGGLDLAALLATIVVAPIFLTWVYRAMLVAHELTPSLTIRATWAIAWFFVPIACLFKPHEVMTEIVTGSGTSAPPAFIEQARGWINWWWGCWILRGITGWLIGFMPVEEGAEAVLTRGQALMLLGSSALGVVSALALVQIIRAVTRMQNEAVDLGAFA